MSKKYPQLGDHVHHRPTGEKWVVAFSRPETDEISWIGWPEGRARLSDCDFVKDAHPIERSYWVSEFFKHTVNDNDFRYRYVRHAVERALAGEGVL